MNTSEASNHTIVTTTKLFSIYIALLPILQYYKSPLSFFNMATFLSVLFFVYFIINSRGKSICSNQIKPIIVYLVFITMNIFITTIKYNYSLKENALDYLRTVLLLSTVFMLGKSYFDYKYAMAALEKVLIFSSFFMVVQLICIYILHHPITGNISFLVSNTGYQTAKERVSGFYMEPAAYAQSAILYLSLSIFEKKSIDSNKYKIIGIIAFGIILSGSGQGYIFAGMLLLMWFFYNMFFSGLTKGKILKGVGLIVLILIVGIAVSRTNYGQYVLSRILPDESSSVFNRFGGSALSGRTYTNKLFYDLSSTQQFWGVGFGRADTVTRGYYVNSLFYYLIECGYISILIWTLMIFSVFVKGDTGVRAFSIIYLLMFYFTGCGRPMMICYYFMFLIFKTKIECNYQENLNGKESGKDQMNERSRINYCQ